MLAAVGAEGTTILENAAMEPEIVNVASLLINMGVKIHGAGTKTIEIEGNKNLDKGVVEVFPDRIESGTYIIIGALLGNNLRIKGIIKEHIEAFLIKLKEVGVKYKIDNDSMIISKCNNLKATNLITQVYPGFPTDLQQPITTLLTQCTGVSEIEETVYERRFQNVEYLNKMGSEIKINDNKAFIYGPTKLKGKNVTATDLRAGACLVLAGLIASGETIIDNVDHILRGYENIIKKLGDVGAKIELIDI
jgi:UDP-N-acetylglucosamine 1-carboxyvinyltransferase